MSPPAPQLEDGYTRIANELLEAYARLHLSPNEWRVLLFIIRKTYGYGRKRDQIPASQFVLATGLDRRNVQAAIKRLSERKILSVDSYARKAVSYALVKDYGQWRDALKATHHALISTHRTASKTKIKPIEPKTDPENGLSSVDSYASTSVDSYALKRNKEIREDSEEQIPEKELTEIDQGEPPVIELTDAEIKALNNEAELMNLEIQWGFSEYSDKEGQE